MRGVVSRLASRSSVSSSPIASTSAYIWPARPFHHTASSHATVAAVARKKRATPTSNPYADHSLPPVHHASSRLRDFDADEQDAQHFPSWDELAGAVGEGDPYGVAGSEWETPSEERLRLYSEEIGDEETIAADKEGDAPPSWEDIKEEFLNLLEKKPETQTPVKTIQVDTRPQTTPQPTLEPPKRPSLQVLETLRDATIKPYLPPPIAFLPSQPHDKPLLSSNDWRLSSPLLPPRARGSRLPPDLHRPRNATRQGLNRLVGVGPDPATETRRWKGSKNEAWGWKLKVPQTEKGDWISCDSYRKRSDRLIALSRRAAEVSYLTTLVRQGSPEQREAYGFTANDCVGKWVGEMAFPEKLQGAISKAAQDRANGAVAAGAWSPTSVVGIWNKADLTWFTPEDYSFKEGTILRFTKECSSTTGPQPAASTSGEFRQGHLLEISDGKLIVAFNEQDVWDIGEHHYRIDKGLDDSSFALQEQAINNLYFDPNGQQTRNAVHVQAAQEALLRGTLSTLRQWTLQGTSLRELLIPDLNTAEAAAVSTEPYSDLLDDHSPTSEIAHLPSPIALLPDDPIATFASATSNPSSTFSDNQLINSWILRHQREVPIEMPGDPELGLNASQSRAVAMALGEKLSLIQGPPGTGKSATIVSIIKLLKKHFRIPQPILLAAPTHVSVDHLLESLIDAGLNPLRVGKTEKVRQSLLDWTIEKRQEQHPLWDKTEAARDESERCRKVLQEHKDKMASKKSRRTSVDETLGVLETAYRTAWRKFIWFEQRLHASLLSTADVFCVTAIGSGSSKIMSLVDFPIVFLDEAAMCTEPVTLIPFMKGAQHVTLIGDHKQLPAVVTSDEAKSERLHESLFERLKKQKSVKSMLLDTQYRMRPSISAFPNQAFYKSALKDSASVTTRNAPPVSRYFVAQPTGNESVSTVFISHQFPEGKEMQTSLNRQEARIVVHLVTDLLQKNPYLEADDIGIISPYSGQVRLLRSTFEVDAPEWATERLGYHRAQDIARVEVNTIDGFQGREKAIIILSTVRSNPNGQIGFLTDKRRLNVALTRAKDALFVVGNARTLKMAKMSEWVSADVDADVGIWRRYLQWLEAQNLVREWQEEDFGA